MPEKTKTDLLHLLALFNERADELDNSTFVRHMVAHGHGFTLSFTSSESSLETAGPSKDALKSFLLDFRMFIQEKDQIQVEQIMTYYHQLTPPADIMNAAQSAMAKWKAFRNEAPGYIANGHAFTNEELQDVILYGHLAHINTHKLDLYKKAIKTGVEDIAMVYFREGLIETLEIINLFKILNTKILSIMTI